MKKILQLLCVGCMGVSLAACSSGLQSKGLSVQSNIGDETAHNFPDGSGDTTGEQPASFDMEAKAAEAAAEEASLEAEAALAEAEAAIAELVDSNGKLKIFSSDVSAQAAEVEALFVSDKLEEVLGKVLEKLNVVPQTFDNARAKLAGVMAKLNPENAAHKLIIDKLMLVMDKIDQAQDRVRVLTSMLADKIDLIIVKVDELIDRLNGNIFTAILAIEVERVKAVILDFKAAVKAL